MTIISGSIWKFGDNIDTDIIIPTRYMGLPSVEEMKQYAFPLLCPDLPKLIQRGDVLVGGENFGCGSSREQAVEVLKALGVGAIIAKSFSRIFFRNGISSGLWLIEQRELPDCCVQGQRLSIDTDLHVISLEEKDFKFEPLPESVLKMIAAGGLVPYMREQNRTGAEVRSC